MASMVVKEEHGVQWEHESWEEPQEEGSVVGGAES